jgi:hypothetical protein
MDAQVFRGLGFEAADVFGEVCDAAASEDLSQRSGNTFERRQIGLN